MLWCASLIWFKTAWSLAETSFEGVDQRQGGPQHNLEFLRRREGWCHCLRDFWRIATAGLPDCHSMVVFCTVDITMFFSLAKCFFYEFPNFNVIYSFCTSVYVGYLGLGRFWRPGGMPWVFCPCQSAPCQAEADRVPRALRALRWCADAAALEFQSIAWCHGRLSSRRIQALGMLEGHRTMFNMFNHIWWSFLNVVLYFNKNVQNVFELSVSTWIGFGTFRFLRTRSFLGAGWLLRRLVAKRSQPRSTSASRVGSSKLRSTPCPTRRGCQSASASSRRNLCVKLTYFLLRIEFFTTNLTTNFLQFGAVMKSLNVSVQQAVMMSLFLHAMRQGGLCFILTKRYPKLACPEPQTVMCNRIESRKCNKFVSARIWFASLSWLIQHLPYLLEHGNIMNDPSLQGEFVLHALQDGYLDAARAQAKQQGCNIKAT